VRISEGNGGVAQFSGVVDEFVGVAGAGEKSEVAGDGKLGVSHGRSGGVERLAWRGCERGGGTQRMLFDFWQWFFGHVLSNVLLGLD
jgi:hypothetical protein